MKAKIPEQSATPSRGGYTLDEFLSMLDAVSKHGNGYIARCPAHDDGRPSLKVKEGDRGIMVNCWAGCTFHEITRSLGINPSMMFYDALDQEQVNKRRLVALNRELRHCEQIIYFAEKAGWDTLSDINKDQYREAVGKRVEIKREIEEMQGL